MERTDLILLALIALLGVAAGVMRMLLARRQGSPLSIPWALQGFVFPALALLALGLYATGREQPVPWLILAAVGQGLLFGMLRRRQERREEQP